MRSYVNRRFLCLDMLPVQWQSCGAESSDAAILLEVGRLGGLLQTSIEVPVHKRVTLTLPNGTISAKVNSCKKDAFGYLVNIAVENSADWFPRSYSPAYLKEKASRASVQRLRKLPAAARARGTAVGGERARK